MFKRAIGDLVRRISQDRDADDVEIYYRMRLETTVDGGGERRGARSYTRIRVLGGQRIREIGIGGWLPQWPVVNDLLALSCFEPALVPMPVAVDENTSPKVSSENAGPGLNTHGYVKDILMTASGMEQLGEASYSVHRVGSVLYRQKPELETSGREDALVFPPAMVLECIKAGAFRGLAASGPAISWFHNEFDGLGGHRWEWSRTPHFLRLVSGSIVLPGLPAGPQTGMLVRRMSVRDNELTVEVDGKGCCCLRIEELVNGTAVSQPIDLFDGEMNGSLPFVELKGDWKWN